MQEIKCPYCNSTQISASKKGFSVGKAALGALTVGVWGLLAGGIGKDKIIVTCLNCGRSWEAGDNKVEPEPPPFSEEEHKLKQAELNAQLELVKIEIEKQKAQAELDELNFIEKQKKEREEYVAENKLLVATMCAFSEAVAKLNRACKQYNFDKDTLTICFDEIIGEELVNAIHQILELDQTTSCYETLKQETIELAFSEESLYAGVLKITEKIEEIVAPIEEAATSKILHFKCLKCGQKYNGDKSNVGQIIQCVSCGAKIELIPYDFLNK